MRARGSVDTVVFTDLFEVGDWFKGLVGGGNGVAIYRLDLGLGRWVPAQ